LAGVYLPQGRFIQEQQCIEQALEQSERVDDLFWIVVLVSRRGRNAFFRGDWEQAQRDLEHAVRAIPERMSRGAFLVRHYSLGLLRKEKGGQEEARRLFATAIAEATSNDNLLVIHRAQMALAEADLLKGRSEQACNRLEPLLAQREDLGLGVTELLPMLGWAH